MLSFRKTLQTFFFANLALFLLACPGPTAEQTPPKEKAAHKPDGGEDENLITTDGGQEAPTTEDAGGELSDPIDAGPEPSEPMDAGQ